MLCSYEISNVGEFSQNDTLLNLFKQYFKPSMTKHFLEKAATFVLSDIFPNSEWFLSAGPCGANTSKTFNFVSAFLSVRHF